MFLVPHSNKETVREQASLGAGGCFRADWLVESGVESLALCRVVDRLLDVEATSDESELSVVLAK